MSAKPKPKEFAARAQLHQAQERLARASEALREARKALGGSAGLLEAEKALSVAMKGLPAPFPETDWTQVHRLIGKNARKARESARISRSELAKLTGLTAQGLYRLEEQPAGKTKRVHGWTLPALGLVAQALGVSVDSLLSGIVWPWGVLSRRPQRGRTAR